VTERDMPANFGLRHRAAIGMSENTDSLIIVVSEETGQISLMKNGQLSHNLSTQELRKKIGEYLYEDNATPTTLPQDGEVKKPKRGRKAKSKEESTPTPEV
jgi:diadenylate cyclase